MLLVIGIILGLAYGGADDKNALAAFSGVGDLGRFA
jgi:hypothetical protein